MTDDTFDGLLDTRQCACLRARKRAREITRRFDAAFRPLGLRATQFSVLAVLAQTGPVPVTKLANILGLERTTLTRAAGVMAGKGWLQMSAADGDERIHLHAITPSGRSTLAEALPHWKRIQDAICDETDSSKQDR